MLLVLASLGLREASCRWRVATDRREAAGLPRTWSAHLHELRLVAAVVRGRWEGRIEGGRVQVSGLSQRVGGRVSRRWEIGLSCVTSFLVCG